MKTFHAMERQAVSRSRTPHCHIAMGHQAGLRCGLSSPMRRVELGTWNLSLPACATAVVRVIGYPDERSTAPRGRHPRARLRFYAGGWAHNRTAGGASSFSSKPAPAGVTQMRSVHSGVCSKAGEGAKNVTWPRLHVGKGKVISPGWNENASR